MPHISTPQLQQLFLKVRALYQQGPALPFHGWHNIHFTYLKAAVFAEDLQADINLTQACALVHDLNYLAVRGSWSFADAGQALRLQTLQECGLPEPTIALIEQIITDAEIDKRQQKDLSPEAKALSDADTLFKALPTTPILFASRFVEQLNFDVAKLAHKIVNDQKPLMDEGNYFYSQKAKDLYKDWAATNLQLWQNVIASFSDPDIMAMLKEAGYNINK